MTRPGRLIRKLQKPAAQGLRRTGIYESGTFYTHRLSLLNRLLARTTKEMLARQFGLSQMEWRVLIQLEHRSPSKISEMHERCLILFGRALRYARMIRRTRERPTSQSPKKDYRPIEM